MHVLHQMPYLKKGYAKVLIGIGVLNIERKKSLLLLYVSAYEAEFILLIAIL